MKKKQIAASLLALTVACSMTACSGKPEEAADTTAAAAEQGEIAGDTNNDGQIDMGVDENVEVKQENASEHMDSFEASTSGKWEAMFTPVDMEGRAIDMADFDLTPTEEELEAMKKERLTDRRCSTTWRTDVRQARRWQPTLDTTRRLDLRQRA